MSDALQQLLDKDEIVDLVHRYSYFVDHDRGDDVVALFTEDCVLDYGPGMRLPVRAVFGGERADGRPGFVVTSHHNANVLVMFEGHDRAVVRTSVHAWHEMSDGAAPMLWGYYHDVVVRTSEGWRFSERVLRVAGQERWDMAWHPLVDPEDTYS
jgi:hypothetical protein